MAFAFHFSPCPCFILPFRLCPNVPTSTASSSSLQDSIETDSIALQPVKRRLVRNRRGQLINTVGDGRKVGDVLPSIREKQVGAALQPVIQ